jgi:hypothetical protein
VTIFYDQCYRQARRISTPDRVDVAKNIVGSHRASAPVDSGAFRDGATVSQNGDLVAVVNRDPDSKYKEYGTSDTPAHATMTNAARRYGRYTGWGAR